MTPEQKRNNRRMGLTLASIAVMFFIGFIVRMVWFSGR
ncbi:cytochrome oxidase small assembly protein [uncultured Variovorax sp.]|nr:cytochrome oxidase small assembly protein [uncultured Variovorax sp.]